MFFKGRNLACAWCHNPESISPRPDLNRFAGKCIGCGMCESSCPHRVITRDRGRVRFDRGKCAAGTSAEGDCRRCAEACPNGAIELKGEVRDVEGLCGEILRDRAYFGRGRGITLSGGEAALQPAAAGTGALRGIQRNNGIRHEPGGNDGTIFQGI